MRRAATTVAQGRLRGANQDRLTFDDLAQALLADYQINGRRSQRSALPSISHMRKFFGFDRAVDITTDRIKAYSADRQKAKAANTNVNRKLAFLALAAPSAVALPIGLWGLFLIFLKFGAVIFGSGYVLLAFLQADLVAVCTG